MANTVKRAIGVLEKYAINPFATKTLALIQAEKSSLQKTGKGDLKNPQTKIVETPYLLKCRAEFEEAKIFFKEKFEKETRGLSIAQVSEANEYLKRRVMDLYEGQYRETVERWPV